jgi:hypothetical protein
MFGRDYKLDCSLEVDERKASRVTRCDYRIDPTLHSLVVVIFTAFIVLLAFFSLQFALVAIAGIPPVGQQGRSDNDSDRCPVHKNQDNDHCTIMTLSSVMHHT